MLSTENKADALCIDIEDSRKLQHRYFHIPKYDLNKKSKKRKREKKIIAYVQLSNGFELLQGLLHPVTMDMDKAILSAPPIEARHHSIYEHGWKTSADIDLCDIQMMYTTSLEMLQRLITYEHYRLTMMDPEFPRQLSDIVSEMMK